MLALAGASLAVFVALSSTASATVTCLAIAGAGSSLQKIAQENVWILGFTMTPGWWEGLCEKDPTITYRSTSSGKGKQQWGYENQTLLDELPFAAFIGTDLAPTLTQIENMGVAGEQPTHMTGTVTVPVAQSAITVVVSLPTNCHPNAGVTEASINATKLKEEWETGGKTFKEYVREIECSAESDPNLKVRSANSGTTAGFKRFFDTLSGDVAPWHALTETPLKSENIEWPMTLELSVHFAACCEKGSELAETVYKTPGTSGYADLADARHEGFLAGTKWHTHENAAHEKYLSAIAQIQTTEPASAFETPEEAGGGSRCKAAVYKEETTHAVAPGADWSEVKQTNVKSNGSYPICTLTYDLAWNSYETPALEGKYGSQLLAEHTGLTVVHYLHSIILSTQGQGSTLTEKNYGVLPKAIREKAETGVNETNIKP
jgi:hypothetical protein